MIPSADRESPLDDILAAYLESVESGTPLDRAELLARHPQFANALGEFFADQDRFTAYLPGKSSVITSAPVEGCPDGAPSRNGAVPAIGERFGDYELLEEIGRGGMGVVFKATQVSLSRTVALKMILSGHLAEPAEIQRFRLEAESAARLDHPNIVPIHEVGAEHGFHYYTMKFINGGNLTAWYRSRPASAGDEKEFARLLATIANAVHHAHQRGVLHRDLKPANILVDAAGQPHVADFGLAKQLCQPRGAGILTPTGATIGTPSYMAPEQAIGPNRITTAADVYSLGCILYELLTAQPPFRAETPLATLLDVLERRPQRPADLRPGLDRDLETICLKCLEKEPAHRYASADELACELRRFADGEPIHARPPGRLERVSRWCRKEPLLAGTLAALAVVGLLAFALVTWQWQRAERNYRISMIHEEAARREKETARQQWLLAEERFDDAHALVDEFCVRLSEDRLKYFPGTQRLREELLKGGSRYYRKFLAQKKDDPSLRRQLAVTHYALACVLGSLGANAEALREHQTALAVVEEMLREDPGTILQVQRGKTLLGIALLHSRVGRWQDALDSLQKAQVAFESLTARAPEDMELQTALAAVLCNMGNLYRGQGKLTQAYTYLKRGLDIRRGAAAAQPANPAFQSNLAITYLNYGNLLVSLNGGAECLECYRQCRAINEKLLKTHPGDPYLQRNLAQILTLIGEHERLSGSRAEAQKALNQSRERLERLVGANPGVVEFERELAATYRQLGHLSLSTQQDEALKWYHQGARLMEKALARQPDAPEVANDLAKCWYDMGTAYSRMKARKRETLHAFEQAYKLREKLIQSCPDRPGFRQDLARTLGNLGVTLWNQGRTAEGLAAVARARDETRRLLATTPQVEEYRRTCSGTYQILAELLWRSGRCPEALQNTRARADLWPTNPGELYAAARDLAKLASEKVQASPPSAEQRSAAQLLSIELQRRAITAGFCDRQTLEREAGFSSLRTRPEFQTTIAAMKEKR